MPKAPRATGSSTPKKRGRKVNSENGNGLRAEKPVTTSPGIAVASQSSIALEEKIRARAYELYLQRSGNGGSPEQDWLQAQQELSARQHSA
jgi:hypothetical protein